jgi:FdhD protein
VYRDQRDPERVLSVPIQRFRLDAIEERYDSVAVEEPLEVRCGHSSLAVIMRTPGNDVELALGFLVTEGLLSRLDDIAQIGHWRDANGVFAENVVTVTMRSGKEIAPQHQRMFYATSSCGMCGKASIEAAMQLAPPLAEKTLVRPDVLYELPDKLRSVQCVFERTGGLHAAALFELDGGLLSFREDVGRHNAVDKLIGRAFMDGAVPLNSRILLISGRVSYEIVQKALVARIPIIAAISAPSSLAVQTARKGNVALVGFLRDGRLNVY